MRNFKAGDKIKMRMNCSGCLEGQIYEIYYSVNHRLEVIKYKHPDGKIDGGCSCQRLWQLMVDIDVRNLNKLLTTPKKKQKLEALEKKVAELTAKDNLTISYEDNQS